MVCIFAGMKSLMLTGKLCNFMTLCKMIKTPQHFVQGSFSIKLSKICKNSEVKLWPQFSFKIMDKSSIIKSGVVD